LAWADLAPNLLFAYYSSVQKHQPSSFIYVQKNNYVHSTNHTPTHKTQAYGLNRNYCTLDFMEILLAR